MKPLSFWFIAVIIALLATWAYLAVKMNEQQKVYDQLENHSEIMNIDTAK